MNYRSSKRAKALAISEETKNIVWDRDGGRCVFCRITGDYTGYPAFPEAHYIPRSKSGLGIPENVLTLCRPHHYMFDRGSAATRTKMRNKFAEYLKHFYPDWDEKNLVYHKEGI